MIEKPNVLIYSRNSTYHKIGCGGAETSLRIIAEKLARQGVKVSYFTNGISRFPGTRKKKINGVDVYFFTPWRWPLLKKRIFPLLASRLIRKQNRMALVRLIKRKNINIVHTYDTYPETFDIIKIRNKYNLQFKIAKRMAGLYWTIQLESHSVRAATIEYVFNNVDLLNFISSGLETLFNEKCEQFGITILDPKKLILDIGVDLDHFTRKNKPIAKNKFSIVCVSRFTSYAKRQDILIDALKLLNHRNIFIEFVGAGKLFEQYKKQILNSPLKHRVTFHGYVTGVKLTDILEAADLFALPTDFEGLGKSVIEAMAMKLPVLVSDVVPLNKYINHNKTGFLVQNKPEKWAEIILKLSEDRKLLSEVAEAGYLFAKNNYNAEINILQYIKAFQNI